MSGSNNFKEFNSSLTNIENDASYGTDTARINGVGTGMASSLLHNKLYRQVSVMVAALAQFVANTNNNASDVSLSALTSALSASIASKNDLNTLISNKTVADTGTANSYIISTGYSYSSLYVGMVIKFTAAHANTGASVVNVDNIGNVSLVKNISTALIAGDISTSQTIVAIYDGTNFEMIPDLVTLNNAFNAHSTDKATSSHLSHIIAGAGTSVAVDGTLSVTNTSLGATSIPTANKIAAYDTNGNLPVNLPISGQNPNLLFNPTGELNLSGWGVANSGGSSWLAQWDAYGRGCFFNAGAFSSGTPVLTSIGIPMSPNVTLTLSGDMQNAISSGNQILDIEFIKADKTTVISEVQIPAVNNTGYTRYSSTFTTPALTAYVVVRLFCTNTTSTQVLWKKIKLEVGSVATTFSDDNTLNTVINSGSLPFLQSISGGNKVQTGSGSITVTTPGTYVSIPITFPSSFLTVPTVTIGITGINSTSGYVNILPLTKTINGFTLYANSYVAQTISFDWTAIGN